MENEKKMNNINKKEAWFEYKLNQERKKNTLKLQIRELKNNLCKLKLLKRELKLKKIKNFKAFCKNELKNN